MSELHPLPVPDPMNRESYDSDLIDQFQQRVLTYWETEGRHFLPWRNTNDPWIILITEVLLARTTARQVEALYPQLTKLTPETLAAIDLAELEQILQPLGLYRKRAVMLQSIAQIVVASGIETLQSEEFLRSLPGVGRYVANAVLCNAFDRPKPTVDTNMVRVICRVLSYKLNRTRLRDNNDIWMLAETILPARSAKEFNWGVLDLGAAVCTPQTPDCEICPLNVVCDWYHVTHE